MIVLDQTTRKLEAVLGGAITTNQLQLTAFFYDAIPQQTTSAPKFGFSRVLSNNTSDVTLVAAPVLAGYRRNIKTIFAHNADTVSATVTIKMDDSGTETIFVKQAISAGESLVYEDGQGWSVLSPLSAPFIDSTPIIKGSVDSTKLLRIEVDGLTTNVTRVLTMPDTNVTLFGAGTKMLFQQTSAPTGWTKDTTHNDKALRVVSGTAGNGGATAFTSVFGSGKSTGSFTLTSAEIPSHTHGAGTFTGSFTASNSSGGSNHFAALNTSDDGSGRETLSVSFSGATGATGSGGGHSHSLSLDLLYLDVIVATKD